MYMLNLVSATRNYTRQTQDYRFHVVKDLKNVLKGQFHEVFWSQFFLGIKSLIPTLQQFPCFWRIH